MKLLKNPVPIAIFAGLLALCIPPFTQAATVTFNYDTLISGSTPAGTSPWITATFDDGGTSGTVTLTMSASGLVPSENISGMYFNLNPALNLSSLSFSYLGTTGPAATSVQVGTDSYKADGDGKYDILFNFPTGSGFDAGETVKYQITGISSLTAQSFNFLSACGNPSCSGPGSFYAAAHVQNINGYNSGWIASNAGVVPIPAAVWLFGSGLLGLVGIARRKKNV
ncbi:MAG: VPLPA-CTERM sorting domain-containing protein [Sulfuricaulis sp.]